MSKSTEGFVNVKNMVIGWGVPKGWKIVGSREVRVGEFFIAKTGFIEQSVEEGVPSGIRYVIEQLD